MVATPKEICEVLDPFEGDPRGFNDSAVFSAIVDRLNKCNPGPGDLLAGLNAEAFVWQLTAGGDAQDEPWGLHFRPLAAWASLDEIKTETLNYWKMRAKASKHPRMRARYADAAWDFAVKITESSQDYECAQIAIDAYLEDADRAEASVGEAQGLRRALHLALKLNDRERITQTRDALLMLQKRLIGQHGHFFDVFHFDTMYSQSNKIGLSAQQIQDMIAGIEAALNRRAEPVNSDFSPQLARELAKRLMGHYRSENKLHDVQRVTRTYAIAAKHQAENVHPALAHSLLEDLHHDFLEAGLREEADSLLPAIRKIGVNASEQMPGVAIKFEITAETIAAVDQMTEGGLEVAIQAIVRTFTPDPEQLRLEMKNLAKTDPLSMFSTNIKVVDEFTRARIGSIEDDESGQLILRIRDHVRCSLPFLAIALNQTIARYNVNAESLVGELFKGDLFEDSRRAIFTCGLRHYLGGDYVACISSLVPQIEHIFRRLFAALGGVTTKLKSQTNAYQEVADLGTILSDNLVAEYWRKAAGNDMTLYFRTVLTDQRAFNIRHRVCHGLCDSDWFNRPTADLLIHILLVLSLLRGNRGTTHQKGTPQ
jgi:hypothetical protein